MAKSITLNIAIFPPETVSRKAMLLSRQLKQHSGMFILDGKNFHPHVTIYLAEFPKKNLKKIQLAVKKIAAGCKTFLLKSTEYSQNANLYIAVGFKNSKEIYGLHKKIVTDLNPLREGLLRQKDINRLKEFSKEAQKNLTEYGYNNALKKYFPHLTFSKLADDNKEAIKRLPKMDFSFLAEKIVIFQSGDHQKILAELNFSKKK